MHTWLEPLELSFMQHGFLAAVLVGLACALLGVYVVLRQMAFIGDALAHTALPGLVLAHAQGWNLFLGALGADLLTAAGIGYFSRRQTIREDTSIGILFTGMFALGIVLAAKWRSYRDLTHMLFGNILGVTTTDLVLMGAVTAAVLLTLAALHKELELASVDPGYAEVIGLRTGFLRYVLLVLLALTVVAGIQVVGVVLTSALLVTPAATASLLTRRVGTMMGLASVFAVGSCVAGLYVSYWKDWPSGATIVVTCTAVFLVVYLLRNLAARRRAAPQREATNTPPPAPSAEHAGPERRDQG